MLLASLPLAAVLAVQAVAARSPIVVVAALLAGGASIALAVWLAGMATDRLAREAEAASRAKDEFLLMVGHELRTPLGAISAAVDVLESPGTHGDTAAQARSIIARQTRSLSHMLNELLDVSRLVSGKTALSCQPLDLAALVQRVQQASAPAAMACDQRLSCRLQPAWAHGDAARLELALARLVAEALRSSPPGGDIVLSVRRDGDLALVEVQSGGESGDGPGTGVTLAQRLVELHGGTLALRARCFTVRLPAAEPVAAPGKDALPAQARRQVLLVEAADGQLTTLRAMLERDGHAVSAVAGGDEGLLRLLQQRPQVAIVDVGLPALAGLELARSARAAGYAGRMIALSRQQGDVAGALAAGFDTCLAEPAGREQLRASIAGN